MRRHKYGAVAVEIDGHRFSSKAEGRRYAQLVLLQKLGEISGLELQPRFPIVIDGKLCATYVADFAYFTQGERVVEDVKGMITPVYRLKKKLVEALYPGTKIVEVKSR